VKLFVSFVAMITFTVIANLLMKTGAVMGKDIGPDWLHLLNWRVLCGLLSFGFGAFIYVLILRQLPLNVAQSFAAAQFIAVVLASAIVLGESIVLAQWLGIVLITCGIAIVGWSQG